MIQWILAIWSLVPLPFLNPTCTFGSSSFIYFWMDFELDFGFYNLKDFEHYLASLWNKCNCVVVWTFFGIALLWDWNKNWPLPVSGHCWIFQICWHIEYITLTASSLRIWNSSAGIPSPSLALFVLMFPKAYLITHSSVSGSRWVITPAWLSRSLRPLLCTVLLCILATS